METQTPDVSTESSPVNIEVPRGSADYAKWRMTGEMPEPKPKAESTPAKETPAKVEKTEEKPAPASEPGSHQEKKPKSNADSRLTELLSDLRDAGLTPAELKSFKQNWQRTQKQESAAPEKAPEKTVNPVDPKAPVKPKAEDFKTYDEYENARDKYYEDLADYRAAKALEGYKQEQRTNAQNESVRTKMEDARSRYGDEGVTTISAAARAITGDRDIPAAVSAMLNDSAVWPDLLYTLGGNAEELQSFVDLAKSNPGEAIRKLVLTENLIREELKGKPAAETPRGEDGKFQKAVTPEPKVTKAPPPPHEVSGRSSTAPDPESEAVKSGTLTRSYRDAENAKDIARRRGR